MGIILLMVTGVMFYGAYRAHKRARFNALLSKTVQQSLDIGKHDNVTLIK